MTTDDRLSALAAQLQEGTVTERRQAVAAAAALLAEPGCDPACRGVHRGAAARAALEEARMITVREAIEALLAAIPPQRVPSLLPDDRQHMIGLTCPNGHITYFDRRRLCTEKSHPVTLDEATVTRVPRPGIDLDEVTVTCGKCDATFKVPMDCGAYR